MKESTFRVSIKCHILTGEKDEECVDSQKQVLNLEALTWRGMPDPHILYTSCAILSLPHQHQAVAHLVVAKNKK